MTVAEIAIAQIKSLPDDLAAEVLDFIGYLKEKQERAELSDLMTAQEDVLARIWDNDDDEVWNEL